MREIALNWVKNFRSRGWLAEEYWNIAGEAGVTLKVKLFPDCDSRAGIEFPARIPLGALFAIQHRKEMHLSESVDLPGGSGVASLRTHSFQRGFRNDDRCLLGWAVSTQQGEDKGLSALGRRFVTISVVVIRPCEAGLRLVGFQPPHCRNAAKHIGRSPGLRFNRWSEQLQKPFDHASTLPKPAPMPHPIGLPEAQPPFAESTLT